MKNIYVSCPMKGRTDEAIVNTMVRMAQVARAILDEDVFLVNPYDKIHANTHRQIECLADNIKKMQDAEYLVCPSDVYHHNGCFIEREVAMRYGIPIICVDLRLLFKDLNLNPDYDESKVEVAGAIKW